MTPQTTLEDITNKHFQKAVFYGILIHHYESTEGDQRCLLSKKTYPSIITQMMTD